MRRWTSLLAALLLLAAAAARAEDADAWRKVRWGMDDAALDALFDYGLRRIDPGLVYGGGLTARRQLDAAEVGGLVFRALFQSDEDGLRQILFERRRRDARPVDVTVLITRLREELGPEDRTCAQPRRSGRPPSLEAVWTLDDGVLHAVFFDFSHPGVYTRSIGDLLHPRPVPRDDEETQRLKGLSPGYRSRGVIHGTVPRRLLLRWRDPAAAHLGAVACGKGPPSPAAEDPAAE